MKSLPVVVLGVVLSVCLLQAPVSLGQEAEPTKQHETPRERRERQVRARQDEKLIKLREPIRKVHAMIDAGDLRSAMRGAGEIRRRLGEPKHLDVEVLFVRLALADGKPELAIEMVEPFQVSREAYDPKSFAAHYFHALATMQIASEPTRQQQQQARQPGTGPTFFGVPLDPETDAPAIEADSQANIRESLVVFDWLAGNADGLEQINAAASAAKALALLDD